jgi:hypothetical protein
MKPLTGWIVLVFAASSPLMADRIDVTGETTAWVHPGALIEIQFGVWNYGWNNPGYSPFPTGIGVQVIGMGGSGSQFQGWLESMDGSVSIPFSDPQAASLGLSPGLLLVRPGIFASGGHQPRVVAVIAGQVHLTLEIAELLFGANIGNYNNAARIRLENVGQDFTLGIGYGYTTRNAVTSLGLGGDGPVRTSGIPGRILVSNPEPSTWLTLGGATIILGLALRRRSAIRSRTGSPSAGSAGSRETPPPA